MRQADKLISVDDHVIEPSHVWQDRVPAKYKDLAPKLVHDENGDSWVYDGKRRPMSGLAAVAGKRLEDLDPSAMAYDEMRPGSYDPKARLEDMDTDGVIASMCFPSYPRFCGQTFYEAADRDLAMICVKAYNDWMIEEWCGDSGGRLIPMIILPLWDPKAAAVEIERCSALGARALSFSENPAPLGLPTVHSPERYWEPVFKAAEETNTIVNMHIGSSSAMPRTSAESPTLVSLSWQNGALVSGTMLDWIFSGVFNRMPNLKIALSEGGIGWIPHFLERAEQVWTKQRYWAEKGDVTWDVKTNTTILRPEGAIRDLDIRGTFKRNVFGCFIEDNVGVRNLDLIGEENVMMETDYPHSDSTWPDSLPKARAALAGLPDETKYKLMQGNARRLYRLGELPGDDESIALFSEMIGSSGAGATT